MLLQPVDKQRLRVVSSLHRRTRKPSIERHRRYNSVYIPSTYIAHLMAYRSGAFGVSPRGRLLVKDGLA